MPAVAALCVLLGAQAAASIAQAQQPGAWPSRPVRMLVGLPPGGTTDLMARATAARLSDGVGQPVVV
ncbi:MAG: tripartite tricarboxylate transporter substrate binding protein, partial [Rhodocyclaceae bacterium]|nr:tripartite tricarboxylate transporter substrate binding protein [Rhodocyclaceae bacterium]